MPLHTAQLTDKIVSALPLPATGYVIHWCPRTAGFGVRLTAAGARAWVTERRIDGKPVRRTLGTAPGATTLKRSFAAGKASTSRVRTKGAVTVETARKLALDVSSELERGTDRLAVKRARVLADKAERVTFGDALRAYVKSKRRAKDGLPLKARTISDYLAMLDPATATAQPGLLHGLANRPLQKITGEEIRALHASLTSRGERQQTYAMQVCRAVLRHVGQTIENNPLASTTAGAKRVVLAPSRGNAAPIPAERLGAWWRAACGTVSASADQLRFMLLTGARPGEAAALLVADVELVGLRAVLRDTKNRRNHTLVFSTQAAAICSWHCDGKRPNMPVFGIADTGKTLKAINKKASTLGVSPHKLRHTFASVAAQLVPAYTLNKLLNHTDTKDVAATHYVGVSDAQLRAAWQAVADFIEAAP